MKKVFVKAALSTLAESGHGWDDISALRWIPARHEKTFSKPIRLNYNQGNLDWENMRQQEKNVAKHPNDVWAKRTPLPHWQNPKTTGTFVGPATQQGIPTDTLMAPQIDATLLGLIGEQGKPNFWRTPLQGAQAGSAGEGFQYGGYDPSIYVKIPTSQKVNPLSLDRYREMLNSPIHNPVTAFGGNFISEVENLKHKFPDVPTRDIWGPSTAEINPLMEGFRPEDYKVAGEPMNLAWRLLKEDNRDEMIENAYPWETHLCKHCGYSIYHHDQQQHGDGSDPPQQVWCGENDCGGECSSPSGFCEPGESLGRTYSDGSPIEATPESHPNRIWLNGRWVDVNDWTDEHTAEEEEGKRQFQVDGQMVNGNWNDTWDWNKDIQTGEPMNLSWRLLKAQQTLDAYHSGNIEEGFEPDVQNVIIASKPGAEEISAEEQSRSHDEMLRRISELEGAEGIRIISARGRSNQWGDENSFMLTNVPDDMMPHIHSLAGEFGQDSILHSPKGTAGTQFVDSSGESEGGLEEGEFTEGTPPNYTEFPMGQKYAYGDYVAVNKGQEYHPSVGGHLEQGQGESARMDPENPGEEIAIQQPVQEQPVQEQPVQQQTYDGRPMPEERIELDSSFWDDMFLGKDKSKHDQWPRITPQEKEEVKERVTTGLQGLINPDGSWNNWAMKNLNHDDGRNGGGPSVAIRTHLFGPDGHRRSPLEDDPSNGDSIISVVNAHSKRGKSVPGFRTVMFRNSEYNELHNSQPFKADGDINDRPDRLNVKNVIDHAPELDDNGGRVALHGVPGKKRKEWRRRGRGDRRRKGYPVYVLNQLGDVLVKNRVSPEAKRHKLEYDTAYEASPERRKYRADLNRERRRRGMYGDHSGRDISHTEGGKLTVEGAHENRGRHFKNQGTLRHVGVKKKANDERKANLVSVVPPLKGENE